MVGNPQEIHERQSSLGDPVFPSEVRKRSKLHLFLITEVKWADVTGHNGDYPGKPPTRASNEAIG